MRFTTLNTYNEIMAYPNMKNWIRFLFLPDCLAFFPAERADKPLRSAGLSEKTEWGDDLRSLGEMLVDTANLVLDIEEGRRKCLQLRTWAAWEPNDDSTTSDPANSFVITPLAETAKKGAKKPAMVICPGGAYEVVSFQNEGTPIALTAERFGYQTFMVNYRMAQNAAYPNPQMDLLETMAYVREHSEEYGVDSEKIVAVGFSAGGHLVASAAGVADTLLPGSKPNAVVLGYPVISLQDGITHEQTRFNLLQRSPLADTSKSYETLRDELSADALVDGSYPPTFVWACEDDDCVPAENTKLLAAALEQNHVAYESHLYPTGGHGCGLAFWNSACSWSESMLQFLAKTLAL